MIEVAPMAQRLIGFLAMQGGRPVRRAFVSGTLWYDAPESRANASLRSAVWRSPVVDGCALVGASNTHLWLHPELVVDLHAASAHARAVLDMPSLDPTSIDVHAELTSFAEDVLVGWYDDWVVTERERFRQLRLHVLDQLGELLLRAHRYSEALQVGLVAVASEPLRESSHRLLVRAHLCEGNLAEAVRQYRTYAGLLARELQVRPSAAMEELVASAVASTGSTRWSKEIRIPSATA
ncbi:MAG: BTAD domain-containing putative transcriptional regulator [Marmoricola sp.]